MKMLAHILALLATLTWLALPAAAMLTVNQLHGFNVGGGPKTITFIGCVDGAGGTTLNTTATPVGAAFAGRVIILGVMTEDDAVSFTFTSATIGGSSATEAFEGTGTGSLVGAVFYTISSDTGTTKNIVVTPSTHIAFDPVMCIWSASGLNSSTPNSTNTDFETAAAATTLDVTVTGGGAAIAICITQNITQTTTWTGATELHDATNTGSDSTMTAADTTTSGSPTAISCDMTGTGDVIGIAAAFN